MRRIALISFLAVMVACLSPAFAASKDSAPDIIYFNGRIVTLDPAGSIASAVAVKDGIFLSVGSTDEVKRLAGESTKQVDLGGRCVVPGLIDAHCHPMETIMMKDGWVDARYPACPSVKQALANTAAWIKKTPEGEWVFVACVSASENKFMEKRLPTRKELDAIGPRNPVVVADGAHLAVANSMALEKLGVRKGKVELKGGGRAIVDGDGEPNGTLTDAMGAIPTTPTLADLKRYYGTGIQQFWNQYGFTSLMAITPSAALPVLQALSPGKKPDIRYTVSVWTDPDSGSMPENLDIFRMPAGADPSCYRFGAIKDWMDGENDCRTGLMYEQYKGHCEYKPLQCNLRLRDPCLRYGHIRAR